VIPNRRLSIAPMIDWTDRFQRYFMRLIAPNALLYTEMIHANAILKGDRNKLLRFDQIEHPVALQLGGSDPALLAEASKIGEAFGYDEINLNVGCPSERVQAGSFGACLMKEPLLVASCLNAMQAAVQIPVTIKCRIGIDREDSYDFFQRFIETLKTETACRIFIIHARSAWLKGLSPKENREIPPLRYEYVYQLKKDFPDLTLILNGGIKTLSDVEMHLQQVDGVMMGREAYHNPYAISEIDKALYQSDLQPLTREKILQQYLLFIEKELAIGTALPLMLKPLLGLFHGQPQGRAWRRFLTEHAKSTETCLKYLREHTNLFLA